MRQAFLEGEAEVLAILEAADAAVSLQFTADHAEYGLSIGWSGRCTPTTCTPMTTSATSRSCPS
ncbi:MAG: hypothetical protein DWI59_05020 [Chloroflexi bacterium]|nr:MAG: hypothetical protein DWI59_05020 [Chloroflexota bacterium]